MHVVNCDVQPAWPIIQYNYCADKESDIIAMQQA